LTNISQKLEVIKARQGPETFSPSQSASRAENAYDNERDQE